MLQQTTRRRALAVVAALSLPLGLGACGLGSDLAGVHDAPAEVTDGAAMTPSAAQKVTSRVLESAQAALGETGSGAAKARAEVLTGPAKTQAAAAVKTNSTPAAAPDVTRPAEPEVLAVSEGAQWPRAILATTRDGDVQRLHLLVAEDSKSAFTLFATVDMASGASVPSLGAPEDGAGAHLGEKANKDALAAANTWAKAVAYPKPKKTPDSVSVNDGFSRALRANADEAAKEVGKLGKLTRSTTIDGKQSASFDLADGGRILFVSATRTDTVTATKDTKKLSLSGDAAKIANKKSASKKIVWTYVETVAMVVPETGKARIVGAAENLQKVVAT